MKLVGIRPKGNKISIKVHFSNLNEMGANIGKLEEAVYDTGMKLSEMAKMAMVKRYNLTEGKKHFSRKTGRLINALQTQKVEKIKNGAVIYLVDANVVDNLKSKRNNYPYFEVQEYGHREFLDRQPFIWRPSPRGRMFSNLVGFVPETEGILYNISKKEFAASDDWGKTEMEVTHPFWGGRGFLFVAREEIKIAVETGFVLNEMRKVFK